MIQYRRDLYQLLPPDFIAVELGCAEGFHSADLLASGAGLLYMVDAWTTLSVFGDGSNPQVWHDKNYYAAMARVAKYEGRYKVLRGLTTEMVVHIPDESLDLCYIDACHTLECVRADIQAYWPKLKPNGVMAFHDYLNTAYGVKEAVEEFCNTNKIKINLIPEDKTEDAGCWIVKL